MLEDILPNIPRWYTAIAECSACLVYVLLVRRSLTRRGFATFVVGLPALLGVQLLAGTLPEALWIPGMLLAVAAMYLVVWTAAQTSRTTAVYLTARAFVLAELAASFQWQLRSYLASVDGIPSQVFDIGLMVVTYAVLLIGAWWLERHHFPRDERFEVDAQYAVSATAIAAVTFFVSNISFITAHSPFSGRFGLEVFYIRTLVDVAGYVALYAQQGERMELQRSREVEAMNAVVRSQHEQYLSSRRNMDVINARYHDLKHYIAAIRAEPDAQLRADYLDQLEASVADYDRRIDSGNPVLDAVLTQRAQQCAAEDITLTCVADGEAVAFVDAMSLAALVGNALDNAIEAACEVPDPHQRLIRVAIYRQDNFAMMRFENYFDRPVRFDNGLPVTTKADRSSHGFGTRNMRQVAAEYDGSLTFETEGNWFVVRVLLPAPTS